MNDYKKRKMKLQKKLNRVAGHQAAAPTAAKKKKTGQKKSTESKTLRVPKDASRADLNQSAISSLPHMVNGQHPFESNAETTLLRESMVTEERDRNNSSTKFP